MPKMEIDINELADFLGDFLQLGEVGDKIKALKKFDWWPFDDDGDEHDTVWKEVNNNWSLVRDAMLAVVVTVEKLVIGGIALDSKQKHKLAVKMLDRAIKLPFFLEPFDQIMIDMLVKFCVDFWNKVNWGLEENEELKKIMVDVSGKKPKFVQIGG